MSTENKRDLAADLALAESVQCVYYDEGGGYQADYPDDSQPRHYFDEAFEGWPHAIRRAMTAESRLVVAEGAAQHIQLCAEEAIAEVERLRYGITRFRDRLICELDAVQSGDTTERTVAYEDCIESTLRRLDRYVLTEVSANDTQENNG